MRLEDARNRLLNPNLRISEIAYDVGFQSLTQFNRTFKRVFGQSPTEFRTRVSSGRRGKTVVENNRLVDPHKVGLWSVRYWAAGILSVRFWFSALGSFFAFPSSNKNYPPSRGKVHESQFLSRRTCRSTSNSRHETEPQQANGEVSTKGVSRHTRAIK